MSTVYTILRQDPDTGTWTDVKAARASSPRRALVVADLEAGMYVAIPVRSWKPLTVKVEQTTKVTIG